MSTDENKSYGEFFDDIVFSSKLGNDDFFEHIFLDSFINKKNIVKISHPLDRNVRLFDTKQSIAKQIIDMCGIRKTRRQWAYWAASLSLSGLLEIDQRPKTKAKGEDNHACGRVIFQNSAYTFCNWASKFLSISPNSKKDPSFYSWNILGIMKKVGFVDWGMWTQDYMDTHMLYLRFNKYGDEDSVGKMAYDYAVDKWKKYLTLAFGKIDKDDWDEYFEEKGYHQSPIDAHTCMEATAEILVNPTSIKKTLKRNGIYISNFSSYYISDYATGCLKRPERNSINGTDFKNIVVPYEGSHILFGSLPYERKSIKKNMSRQIKKDVAILRGFKVMNDNHCFHHPDFRDFFLYAARKSFEDLFGDDLWTAPYGGSTSIETIRIKGYSSALYESKFYNCKKRVPEIHWHHFLHERTIETVNSGFLLHNPEMIFLLFHPDHVKTNNLSEAEEIKFGLDNKWYTISEIKKICLDIVEFIEKKEIDMDLVNSLSKEAKEQFSAVLNNKILMTMS